MRKQLSTGPVLWAQAELRVLLPVLRLRTSQRLSLDLELWASSEDRLCAHASTSFLLQSRPSLPSSACWAGTHSGQWPQGGKKGGWGRAERGPSSRECNSPRHQNSSWSQAQGPAWDKALRVGRPGLFLPPVSLAGHCPPPDTLLCSLTLESPTHPIPAPCPSPSLWTLDS